MRKWFIDRKIHFMKERPGKIPEKGPAYTEGFYIEEHTDEDGHKFYHLYTVYEEGGYPYWEETISLGDCFEAYYEDEYDYESITPMYGEKYGELIEENSEP